jgi:hypothetical protein
VIVLEALLILLVVALLALSLASGRWAALAQNAPITTPPNVVSPPQAVLPDLGAPPGSIHIKLMCKANSLTATLSVTVYNFGKVDADLGKHPFHHIVTARVAKVNSFHQAFQGNMNQIVTSPGAGPAVLKGGKIAKTTITLTNIPRSALQVYRFEIITDPDNLVAESSETNNLTYAEALNICK